MKKHSLCKEHSEHSQQCREPLWPPALLATQGPLAKRSRKKKQTFWASQRFLGPSENPATPRATGKTGNYLHCSILSCQSSAFMLWCSERVLLPGPELSLTGKSARTRRQMGGASAPRGWKQDGQHWMDGFLRVPITQCKGRAVSVSTCTRVLSHGKGLKRNHYRFAWFKTSFLTKMK